MIMEGCQGKKDITIEEKICPRCGHPIEIFSIDTEMACENCGFVVYNDALSCVQWCQYARKCVGDEMYERMMAVAKSQKERREAAKKEAEKEADKNAEKNA
jgi:ribosomal protein S27AE